MLALDAPCQRKCAQLHPVAIEKLPAACCGEQRHPTTPSLGLAVEEQDSFPHPYPEQATPTVWFPEMIAVLVRAGSKNPRCGKWPLAGQELLVLVLWRRLSPRGASSTSPCAKCQSPCDAAPPWSRDGFVWRAVTHRGRPAKDAVLAQL